MEKRISYIRHGNDVERYCETGTGLTLRPSTYGAQTAGSDFCSIPEGNPE